MAQFCVNVRLSVRETDPTGEACSLCGDTPFLLAAEAILILKPGSFLPVCYLCGNCAETLQDRLEAGRAR